MHARRRAIQPPLPSGTSRKRWTYARNEYLSGEITAHRIDVPALGLTPLRLEDHGVWDPDEEYWCEEGEPLPEWALPVIARGPRREYEMEQVLPGDDSDDPDGDPIFQSNDLKDRGYFAGAQKMLMQLLDTDLRCMSGYGLCLWRLGKMTEAAGVFERTLWLNPSDNQGECFNLHWSRAGRAWERD
ncbi:hypothetical protein L6Q96_21240 [Candidatus Binatia bacterium]|nr:hypothetical protein [Candidatus Binatia bacterium]